MKRWNFCDAARTAIKRRCLQPVVRLLGNFATRRPLGISGSTSEWLRQWRISRSADGKKASLASCTGKGAMRWNSLWNRKLWWSAGRGRKRGNSSVLAARCPGSRCARAFPGRNPFHDDETSATRATHAGGRQRTDRVRAHAGLAVLHRPRHSGCGESADFPAHLATRGDDGPPLRGGQRRETDDRRPRKFFHRGWGRRAHGGGGGQEGGAYHGWVYALDGRLIGTPDVEGVEFFDRTTMGMVPLRLETWEQFLFVNFDPEAEPLSACLGDIPEQARGFGFEGLQFAERRDYVIHCNWKVYVDNYLEGYNIPH